MASYPTPNRPVALSPADEALELRDIGASDLSVTEAEECCDRLNAVAEGWRDAVCETCSCAIYVPREATGDVLCEACKRLGIRLAAEDDGDDDPDRPNAGAMLAEYAAEVAGWRDDDLITAVGIVDGGRDEHWFKSNAERAAWLSAATSEVLRRSGRLAA